MRVQRGTRTRRTLALLIGALVLTGVGVGAPATDARAGVPAMPVDPGPVPRTAPYQISAGVRSAQRAVRRPAAPVSVMSFNVCGGVCRRGEVARTAAYTARTAVARHASVVLLQELCYSQFLRIRALLAARGYAGRFAAATRSGACDDDDRHGRAFGVAVLVRGTAFGQVVKPLPTPAGVERRLLLGVTASVSGRETFVAVVHLSPSPRAGLQRQLAVLARYLNPRAARPLIVGGDFNSLPDNPGLGGLYSAAAGGAGRFTELDETRTGVPQRGGAATFDTAGRKIDYVFLSERWFRQPRAASMATSMSDHCVYLGTARVVTG
jgi:endonuclease/exonuclease/phosphatase family metal-dependent hydrolase